MSAVRDAVLRLLQTRATIRSGDVVDETRLARQVVQRHLRRMVSLGELVMRGNDGGARYQKGAGLAPDPRQGLSRGDEPDGFWSALARSHPTLAYVRLSRLGTRFHLRAQARSLAEGQARCRYLVVDFRDVAAISVAFAAELFIELARRGHDAEPINASAEVEAVIDRARRYHALRTSRP